MGTRILSSDMVGSLLDLHFGIAVDLILSVTAIFLAMMAQYRGSRSCNDYKSQLLSQQLKSNLLSLRQFEQCYILARWIQNLFKDILQPPREAQAEESGARVVSSLRTTSASRVEPRDCQSNSKGWDQRTDREVQEFQDGEVMEDPEDSIYQASSGDTTATNSYTNDDTNLDENHRNVETLSSAGAIYRAEEWFPAFPDDDLFQSACSSTADLRQIEGLHYLANVVGSTGFNNRFQ